MNILREMLSTAQNGWRKTFIQKNIKGVWPCNYQHSWGKSQHSAKLFPKNSSSSAKSCQVLFFPVCYLCYSHSFGGQVVFGQDFFGSDGYTLTKTVVDKWKSVWGFSEWPFCLAKPKKSQSSQLILFLSAFFLSMFVLCYSLKKSVSEDFMTSVHGWKILTQKV